MSVTRTRAHTHRPIKGMRDVLGFTCPVLLALNPNPLFLNHMLF